MDVKVFWGNAYRGGEVWTPAVVLGRREVMEVPIVVGVGDDARKHSFTLSEGDVPRKLDDVVSRALEMRVPSAVVKEMLVKAFRLRRAQAGDAVKRAIKKIRKRSVVRV